MKKILSVVLSLLFVGTLFARDKITIVGSSTVYPFTTVVAENMVRRVGKLQSLNLLEQVVE